MKRSKFTDEQILAIVNEGEAGRKVPSCVRPTGSASRPTHRRRANARHPGAQAGRRKKG
jgi:hypothetical protein